MPVAPAEPTPSVLPRRAASLRAGLLLALLFVSCVQCVVGAGPPRARWTGRGVPPKRSWRDLVHEVTAAGCVTTDCDTLRHFYDADIGSCFHEVAPLEGAGWGRGRGGPARSERGVCCKPIVLISSRAKNCPSCDEVWGQMTVRYKAELDLLGEYVTFVNGGEPMINELTYRPYPLPLPFSQQQLNAMEDFSLLHGSLGVRDGEVVPRSALPLLYLRVAANDSAATSPAWLTPDSTSVDLAEEMAARAALSSEAREDLLAHETALRRRAAYTAAHPPALMTHQWERYLRKAFSGQGEYVFRAVFMYPHNGSVMRDVFNEDILVAVDNYIHYYSTPQQLFTSLKKSVRVFEDVMRREVLAHCS